MFTFIESAAFSRWREAYLDDDAYRALQEHLVNQPESGKLIRDTGGLRKLRWRREGTGKSGGLRVIYYVRFAPNEIWLLTLYAKSRSESVPSHILRHLREEFER